MGFMPLIVLLLSSIVLCSPHNQKLKEGFREKVEDGIYSARDSDHYKGGKHNRDFDHEAVLGRFIYLSLFLMFENSSTL